MPHTTAMRNANNDLNLTAFLVIEEHRRLTGRHPTGLHFNKVMSLADRELGRHGIDIRLPHCWYRYGDEVVRQMMPTFVRWNHEDPSYCKISWTGNRVDREHGTSETKAILDIVRGLVKRFAVPGGTSVAVGEVYAYAPFEFQRRFKRLTPRVERLVRDGRRRTKKEQSVALTYLANACEAFPTAEFPTVAEQLPAFKSAMTYSLSDRRIPSELAELFWFWFCYHLRLHPRAHENVPEEILEYWASRLGDHDMRFTRLFGDIVLELMTSLPEVGSDPDLKAIATARLEERQVEDSIMTEFEPDLKGLEQFVRSIRSAPSSRHGA